MIPEDLTRFYARAQAQALRHAYNHAECLSDLIKIAEEMSSTL
jgi:hypothetical protein